MSDTRELILGRLEQVALSIDGIVTVKRNTTEISEGTRPAIIILEADESGDDGDRGRKRPTNSLRRVGMTPEIWIMATGRPDEIGPLLNSLRAKLIKAILTDVELQALCMDGDIFYEGCATALARGRNMEGEMGVSFTFTYILRPDQLTS